MNKILVALSGGVDSAVTVGLLRRAGYTVGGAFMVLHDAAEAEAESARAAAARQDIPFHLFDWRAEFREAVIRPFARIYRDGGTPNPCVICNKTMKFGKFLDEALALGYDGMATGHYAEIVREESGKYRLLTALDESKDQTYMLHALTQAQLARIILPLGPYTKAEVRALAAEWGLPQASRHDSQDICFIPDGDYMTYLAAHGYPPTPGEFIGTDGTRLGPHRGFEAYTIGQRRGLEIAAGHRVYVVEKRRPDVVLGESEALFSRRVFVENVNWIAGAPPAEPLAAAARLRYTARPEPCRVIPAGSGAELLFDRPQRAVTPGQSAVFILGRDVLGGGVITGCAVE